MTAFDHTHRWSRVDGQPNLFRCSCGDYGHATGNNIVRRPPPKPKAPKRTCAGEGCTRSLDGRHEQAVYCSRTCQGGSRKSITVDSEIYNAIRAEAAKRNVSMAKLVESLLATVGVH